MISNQQFQVFVENKGSRYRRMNEKLPQGSVLAPTLFNLYISDLLKVHTKFQFADDIAITCQSKDLTQSAVTLNEDLKELNKYFRRCRLKANPNKTEVCAFHLTNKQTNRGRVK